MSDRTQELITLLQLEPHVEGGWFRRTWCSQPDKAADTSQGKRDLMSTIYYLLTADAAVGYFHCNRSDIMHYFHEGDAIQYFLIWPDGRLEMPVMGREIKDKQLLQLQVPGGVWKASRLMQGDKSYGLISEAVSPGFEYEDMMLASAYELCGLYPRHSKIINLHCQP